MIVRSALLLALAVAAASAIMSAGAWSTQPEQAVALGSGPEESGDAGAAGVVSDVKIATSSRPAADCTYAIVPGGLYSRDDVRAAIERDAVVAAHFTAVNIGALREEHAADGRRVYVSYRIGNDVFWSRDRVALEQGEVVLTDGRYEIRARCGNLISDGPHYETVLRYPGHLPVLGIPNDETGSSLTTAAGGDLIEPAGSGSIGLPGPGSGGSPSLTNPWGLVILPGQAGGSDQGSSGDGGGTAGGGGGGNAIGGGAGGGSGSGEGDSRSGGGSGSGGDSNPGGGSGSGDVDDSHPGGGGGSGNGNDPGGVLGQGGPGSSGGGSPSSPNSNSSEEPGSENPGGPGNGGTGSDKPDWVLVAQSDGYRDEPVSVPEPTSLSLFVLGLGAAALAGRRNRKR